MSNNYPEYPERSTTPPPPPAPAQQYPTAPGYPDLGYAANPQAQAKAAKAYAKANRPLWKKKRTWILGIVALIIVIAVATSGGGNDGPTATDGTAASESKAEGKTFNIGQAVELEGTRYTVTGARTKDTIGGEYGESADGVFVVVDLSIENTKNETRTFMDTAATFIAKDGTVYEGSDASWVLGDDSLFLRDMQPDLTTKGKLVFDVPPAKVAGGVLEVSDLFGRGEARINLGLK